MCKLVGAVTGCDQWVVDIFMAVASVPVPGLNILLLEYRYR